MIRRTAATLSLSLAVACIASAVAPVGPVAAAPASMCGSVTTRLRSTQAIIERVRRTSKPMRADSLSELGAARVRLSPRGTIGCEDLARTRQGRLRIYDIDALLAAQYPRLARELPSDDCRGLLRASLIDALARANLALEGTHEFAQPIGDAPTFVNAVREDVRDAAHTLDLTLPAGVSAASFLSSTAAAYDAATLLAKPAVCVAYARGDLASTSPVIQSMLFDTGL